MTTRPVDPGLKTFVDEREQLIALACCIVESRSVAEELVQESWVRWQSKNYHPDDAIPVFRRIVANLAKDWYRRQRTEKAFVSGINLFSGPVQDAECVVIARSELTVIVKTLLSMSDKHIKAFRKRTVHGMTYTEIARDLGVSVGYAYRLIEQVMVEIYLALDS